MSHKHENNEVVEKMIERISKQIDAASEHEVKEDMKMFVSSLVGFIGNEQPGLFDENIDGEKRGMLFLRMAMGLGKDAMVAKINPYVKKELEAKFAGVMKVWPMLKKYSGNEGQ